MSFLNIMLFGAPGSGKGTQSKFLANYYNLFHLSTGDLLREARNNPSSLFFKEINDKMEKGELVSDEIIYGIVSEKIKNVKNSKFAGIIFDGFPRNASQAEFLQNELQKNAIPEIKTFLFEINEDAVIDRIINRFTCSNCNELYNKVSKPPKQENRCDSCGKENSFSDRTDDNAETIKNRLRVFNKNMEPLLAFYKNMNKIDASLKFEEIFESIKKILEK